MLNTSVSFREDVFRSLQGIGGFIFVDSDTLVELGDSAITVLYFKGQLAGYILLGDDEEIQEICYIEILPQFRHRGLGTLLFQHVIDPNRPVSLFAYDAHACAFFNKVKAMGLAKDMEIIT